MNEASVSAHGNLSFATLRCRHKIDLSKGAHAPICCCRRTLELRVDLATSRVCLQSTCNCGCERNSWWFDGLELKCGAFLLQHDMPAPAENSRNRFQNTLLRKNGRCQTNAICRKNRPCHSGMFGMLLKRDRRLYRDWRLQQSTHLIKTS